MIFKSSRAYSINFRNIVNYFSRKPLHKVGQSYSTFLRLNPQYTEKERHVSNENKYLNMSIYLLKYGVHHTPCGQHNCKRFYCLFLKIDKKWGMFCTDHRIGLQIHQCSGNTTHIFNVLFVIYFTIYGHIFRSD